MYYAIYKNVRNSAWQCLLDFELNSLPIDVLHVAFSSGIRVIRNSLVHDLLPGENGKTYFDGERWTILYDDLNATELSRYTIAHELGHIFLGHELQHSKYAGTKEFKETPTSEKHANAFAIRLLCPACVIWRMELHTADEIARCCRVEPELAAARAKRMKTLYTRGKFLTDPMEQELDKRFQGYIQSYIQHHAPALPRAKN